MKTSYLTSLHLVLAASSCTALMVAQPTLAQDLPAKDQSSPQTPPPESAAQSSSGQSSSGQSNSGVEDIVVTAQRRSENVQKSSLSLQVLGGDVLEKAGASRAENLNELVPGIKIAATGSTIQISIRGVGDQTTNPLGNPTVAFNVDGVYIGRPSAIGTNFFDVQRIEVLKGPQGTLYGRNAAGGAVNIITNAPKLGIMEGYAEADYGNYNSKRLTAAVNAPLTPNWSVRGAFQIVDRDGYLSDGTNDQKTQAVRLRSLWKPRDAISLLINFDAAHAGGAAEGTVLLPRPADSDPWDSINSPTGQAVLRANVPPGSSTTGTQSQKNDFINVSGQFDWNFGPATLTVIPAYHHTEEQGVVWNGFLYQQKNTADQTSVEARLSHNGDRLKWVLGGFYFDETQVTTSGALANVGFVYNAQGYRPTDLAYAAFGEATFSIVDRLRIIGGIRYTSERKTLVGFTKDLSFLQGPTENYAGDVTFKKTNWKAGFEFDVSPKSLVFFTASTGFKTGGINTTASTPFASNIYQPENLTAYTAGWRNRFFDNRLQVNVEGFYWDYKNRQESAIGFTSVGGLTFLTSNAASATLKGGSIDIVAKPTSHDTIRLFSEYNDAKYDQFVSIQATPFGFNPATSGCAASPVSGSGGFLTQLNCSGFQLTKAPKVTGAASWQHRFNLSGGATIDANLDGQFSSNYYIAAAFIPATRMAGYALANASLTLTSRSGIWALTGYVRNLSNHAVYTSAVAEPLNGTLLAANIAAPRTYGARVRFQF